MGYFLFKIKLLYIIPPRIIVIAPIIIGNIRNSRKKAGFLLKVGKLGRELTKWYVELRISQKI